MSEETLIVFRNIFGKIAYRRLIECKPVLGRPNFGPRRQGKCDRTGEIVTTGDGRWFISTPSSEDEQDQFPVNHDPNESERLIELERQWHKALLQIAEGEIEGLEAARILAALGKIDLARAASRRLESLADCNFHMDFEGDLDSPWTVAAG